MDDTKARDERFRAAVSAIDVGDITELERLLTRHPMLACERLDAPGAWLRDKAGKALDDFFQKPYLLWFVAEDPVRNGALPANIADLTRTVLDSVRRTCPESLQEQMDYTLRLVAWSWIARQSGVQIGLIDVLMDAGASSEGAPDNALVNGNVDAATHLVDRGATLTLATALCLGRWDDATRLAGAATAREKQFALTLSALRGKAKAVRRVIEIGVDVNAVSPDLYSHATALHHAVGSGSLDAVRVLVECGANLGARDTVYNGTPLEWAEQSRGKPLYDDIAAFLRAAETDPSRRSSRWPPRWWGRSR